MSGKTPSQPAAPSVENQAGRENTPNRFRKRALRRQLVRYGFFLGGAAALLWIVYADRSLIGGRDLYTLANTNATARSATSAESMESPSLDAPPESANSALTIYRTVRQILLREEPRFGAAAEIMLDRGARLIVLDINGRWLKVKMEETGTPGFVREEFVVPEHDAEPSKAIQAKSDS